MNRCVATSAVLLAVVSVGLRSAPSGGQTAIRPKSADLFVEPGHRADLLIEHEVQFLDPDQAPSAEVRELQRKDRGFENATRKLLSQYRAAESSQQRSPILQELSKVVADHFEVRQQVRANELEALEARIRKLRDLHEKRERAKPEIVERRVEQLVREAEGLGWGSGDGHQPHPPGADDWTPFVPESIRFNPANPGE